MLNRASEILKLDHSSIDEITLTSLKTALEQLSKKQQTIRDLDERIAEQTTDPKELETEIYESEELNYELDERLNHIRKYIELCSFSRNSNQFVHESQPSPSITPTETPTITQQSPQIDEAIPTANPNDTLNEASDNAPIQPNSTSEQVNNQMNQLPPNSYTATSTSSQNVCRLPKLSLPVFSGNSLEWQSFWDSFDAAVHSNHSLTGIQRFNYLKAQLKGEALQTIAGFPLTNSTYDQAINLLKDRFGQPHKIVNAHMQALLEIPPPNENIDSFRSF